MVSFSQMEDVLYKKMQQHPDLRSLLMGTGMADIVYSDANDSFWGDAMGPAGPGQNHLGKMLVRVRENLRHHGLA